jgi:hypothetical protein
MTVTDATFAGTLPAIQRTQDHRYGYQGVWYPGATTALGVLDKSAPLMHYAADQTAEALMLLYETDGDVLKQLYDAVGRDGVKKAVMDRRNWKRDEAAKLGTKVHSWADALVASQPLPALTETERAYAEHYAEWWQKQGWQLRLSEALVVSPAEPGAHEGWGGTFDLLVYDADGKVTLADIKTGKGIYREAILQLAAYGMSKFVSPMGSEIAYPMPMIERYVIIHVTREGVRTVDVSIGAREWHAWLACLDLYRWTETVKGRL